MLKQCNKSYCKKHAEYSDKLSRYKGLCLHHGKCVLLDIASSPNIITILDMPIKDGYKILNKLTDEELAFCINNEKRKSGISKLNALKKRSGKANENIGREWELQTRRTK